jgi:hypothetical protein
VTILAVRVGAVVSALTLATSLGGCGDEGLFPTTVDPGPDFSIADLLFDEGFFYCQVEPRAITPMRCGPGDPAQGDSSCHATITSFRLKTHPDITCDGNLPTGAIPTEARGNYTNAQSRMRRDPNSSPLLLRPLQKLEHPRQVITTDSDAAAVIREWANHVTTQ